MTEETPQTPSEELAKRVVSKLIEERLLSREEAGKILSRLATGRLSQEDWRRSVEASALGAKA